MALIIAPICGTNKVLHHCILAIDSACPRVSTRGKPLMLIVMQLKLGSCTLWPEFAH